MSDYLIVVTNRAGARFFTLEPVEFPELESGPRLVARLELENPEIKEVREKYTDAKTGRGAAPQGGGVHGYEDKRDQHLDQLRRRFAAKILKRIREIVRTERVGTVVLASSVSMRQFLYPELDTLARQGCRIHKISKNMINFSPQKIHDCLADDGCVPRQKKT
jgi:hypothetical protein